MFSAHCLEVDERFEVKIDEVDEFLSGGIKIDLTSHELGSQQEGGRVRQELAELRDCWWLEGSTVLRAGQQLKLNYGPSLERLQAGDRVGVKRTAEGAMKILINGEDAGGGEPGGWGGGRVRLLLAQGDEPRPRARPGGEPGQPPGGQPPQHRAREGGGGGAAARGHRGRHRVRVPRQHGPQCGAVSRQHRGQETRQLQPGPGDVRPAAAPGLSPASLHLPVPQLNLKRESWLVALGGGAGQRGPQEEVRAAYRLGQVPAPPSEAAAGRRGG